MISNEHIKQQLEHIKSDKLVTLLDDFLGSPKFDPHGDPIPDEFGGSVDDLMKGDV